MSISSLYGSSGLNASMLDYIQNNESSSKKNSLVDYLSEDSTEDDELSSVLLNKSSSQRTASTSSKAANAYSGGINSEIGKAALNRALAELSGKVEGKLTLAKVYEYRQNLETEFTVGLRLAMAEKGLDPEEEFVISMDSQGQIKVSADDPATRLAVEKHLEENPSLCEQFGYIQALGNLERAQQSSVWQGISNIKTELVANAMEHMFNDTLDTGLVDYSALTAQFSTGSDESSFYTGLNFTI